MRISLGWRTYNANFGRTCDDCGCAVIKVKDEDGNKLDEHQCSDCGSTSLKHNVAVDMKPLPVGMLMDLLPHFKVTGATVILQSFLGIQEASKAPLSACTRNLHGLQDEAGEEITIEQVSEETVLTDLAVELIGELVSISRLNEEELGN